MPLRTFELYECFPICSVVLFVVANAPSQPENVRLSMTSSGHVLVAWDAPTVNTHLVDFYLVQYSADSAAGQITTNSSLVRSLPWKLVRKRLI